MSYVYTSCREHDFLNNVCEIWAHIALCVDEGVSTVLQTIVCCMADVLGNYVYTSCREHDYLDHVCEILVVIAYASSEGLDETAHLRSLV